MRIVVAGGGPSGLYTAWKLAEAGHGVTVLEREAILGGLAASVEMGGNFYNFGTHHLHSPDPAHLAPFKALLGDELIEHDRRLEIKFMGRFYPYPLKTGDILRGMPWGLTVRSLLSLGLALLGRRFKKEGSIRNAEEAIVSLYGRTLYEVMFRDYTARFWGMEPSRISSIFVDKRMPGINAVERFKQILRKAGVVSRASLGKTAVIGSGKMYTTPRGSGRIFEAMGDAIKRLGGEIVPSAELVSAVAEGGRLKAVVYRKDGRGVTLPLDFLVSTIPVNHLVKRLEPKAPEAVRAASDRIGFRGLLVVGLLVRLKKKSASLFTYYHDRSFHRLAQVLNPPGEIRPEGSSILLAEMTCDRDDALWNDPDAAGERVVRDLIEEGLIDADGVLEIHYLRAAEAYPKYTLGFDEDLKVLKAHLETYANVKSTGRQGAFKFTSMIPSMQMAWRDTEETIRNYTFTEEEVDSRSSERRIHV